MFNVGKFAFFVLLVELGVEAGVAKVVTGRGQHRCKGQNRLANALE